MLKITSRHHERRSFELPFLVSILAVLMLSTGMSLGVDGVNSGMISYKWKNTFTHGEVMDLELVDDLAYLTTSSGLLILNISNPLNPTKVGFLGLPSIAYGLDIVDDIAYVANSKYGIQIIDISDPEDPKILRTYRSLEDDVRDIVVKDGYAYYSHYSDGVRKINVKNYSQINLVHWTTISNKYNAITVDIKGDYLFVAYDTLRVFDISGKTFMEEIHKDSGAAAEDFVIDGDIAYTAAAGTGMNVVDISDPEKPSKIAGHDGPGRSWGVDAQDDYLYIAVGEEGLLIYNVTDPSKPQKVIRYDLPGDSFKIKVRGNYAYLASKGAGLRIVDISDPEHPIEVSSYDDIGYGNGITIEGQYGYTLCDVGGVQVYDLSNVEQPVLKGKYKIPGSVKKMVIINSTAFIAYGKAGLQIVSLAEPTNLVKLGEYNTTGSTFDIAVKGELAYLADGNKGLVILDISDLSNPTLLNHIDTDGKALDIAIKGNFVFLADDNKSLKIFDVSDPENSVQVGKYKTSERTPKKIKGITIYENLAYVVGTDTGLIVLDISKPENVTEIMTNGSYTGHGITVDYPYVYVASDSDGAKVYDITNSRKPILLGRMVTSGTTREVVKIGDHFILANDERQFHIIKVTLPPPDRYLPNDDSDGPVSFLESNTVYIAGGIIAIIIALVGALYYFNANKTIAPQTSPSNFSSRKPTGGVSQSKLPRTKELDRPHASQTMQGNQPSEPSQSTIPPPEYATIQCPGCQAKMKVPKLGKLQDVRCESCGLEGKAEI